jgi:hypothetical protein
MIMLNASWYDQPLFNTLLTLFLGGIILDWLKTRWARDEKKREKTLEFLEATGDRLNHLLSRIFGALAIEDLGDDCLTELKVRRSALLEKRFVVRLGAEAYLCSPSFWVDYDFLAKNLYEVVKAMERLAKQPEAVSDLVAQIRDLREMISREWPISDDDPPEKTIAHRNEALKEIHRWVRMIWHRAIHLISVPLQEEINSGRKRTAKERPTPALQRTAEAAAERS